VNGSKRLFEALRKGKTDVIQKRKYIRTAGEV
jgi:hypothetical protein